MAPERVAEVASALYEMGCYEISLGDTIGVGTPGKTKAMIEACAKRVPIEKLAGHYHDTYGQALANIYASLEMGVRTFDASDFGIVIESTPLLNDAFALSPCTSAGSSIERWNSP